MNRSTPYLIAAALGLSANIAQAHDVWLATDQAGPSDAALPLVYGHMGEPETYDPAKVKQISAYDLKGKSINTETKVSDNRMTVKPRQAAAMITIEYDNGYWTKIDADTWENQSKSHFKKYDSASHSLKYNKNLLGWNEQFKQPVGLSMEIVPLSNPLTAKAGDILPVQVLYNGKPLAEAVIEVHGDDNTYKTDQHGRASLPLAAVDKHYIAAYHRYALDNHPDADEKSVTANLVFRTQ